MRIKIFLISFFLGSTVYASPVIVLPDKPDMLAFPAGETQAYAADFLNRHLERATGRKLKIIREKDAAKFQERIFIGATAASRRIIGKLEQLEPETLIVKSDGKDLFLCGEMTEDRVDRGTLFAVYEYLERALGIRWYFPDDPRIHPDGFGVIIPGNHNLRLDGWNIRDWPRLRGREGGVSYYAMPEKFQRLWHPVLRFGNSMPRKNANHTQTGWYALYGKTHPEYFAVGRNGRQQFNTQYPHRNYLCPNQPGVLKQMLRNLDAFDQGRAPDSAWGPCPPEKNCVYFAFNDGMTPENSCQCLHCRSQYEPDAPYEKQASEWAFLFVARYAEAIRKRWPERRLATLAYQHYQAPPEKHPLPGNVDVTYVTARLHYASSPEMLEHELAKIRSWSKLLGGKTDRLGIWLNIVDPVMHTSKVPFLYPNILKRWLLKTRHLAGSCFINGLNPRMNRNGKEGRLNAFSTYPMVWLQSRLLWNPERDIDELLRDYTEHSFGPAAETMRKFYNLIISRWEDLPYPPETEDETGFIHRVRYGGGYAGELRRLLDKAAGECALNSPEQQRIIFWRDHIYSRFFRESALFHQYADRIPEYRCKTVDSFPDASVWRNQTAVSLLERQWGGPPEKKAVFRMVRYKNELFLQLETENAGPNEEFRVFTAEKNNAVQKNYAPNINRAWPLWKEYRIGNNSKGSSRKFPAILRLPLDGQKEIRLQIMRYGGVWNQFDLWSPTLRPISEFPTGRFGKVTFESGE